MFRRLFFSLAITFSIHSVELPQSQFTLEKTGFTLCYDGRLKQPSWVMEVLTSDSLIGDIKRDKFRFKEDQDLPKTIRSTLLDYKGSNFDIGHLSPSSNHISSENLMRDGFLLSNASPQVPSFNRGYWIKLEKHVRQLARDNGKVKVFSGPLFLAKMGSDGKKRVTYEVIGDNEVAVPIHFFKVIQTDDAIEVYILPNGPISSIKPLSDFRETLEKVERVSGMVFHSSSSKAHLR